MRESFVLCTMWLREPLWGSLLLFSCHLSSTQCYSDGSRNVTATRSNNLKATRLRAPTPFVIVVLNKDSHGYLATTRPFQFIALTAICWRHFSHSPCSPSLSPPPLSTTVCLLTTTTGIFLDTVKWHFSTCRFLLQFFYAGGFRE